ncbi:hypothetical protein BASA61_000719 [Batrachochytrium salamandrivorans]|nr:hypothetical protein BASA61_000719 [Batrachochytrium salamandrivorans]
MPNWPSNLAEPPHGISTPDILPHSFVVCLVLVALVCVAIFLVFVVFLVLVALAFDLLLAVVVFVVLLFVFDGLFDVVDVVDVLADGGCDLLIFGYLVPFLETSADLQHAFLGGR